MVREDPQHPLQPGARHLGGHRSDRLDPPVPTRGRRPDPDRDDRRDQRHPGTQGRAHRPRDHSRIPGRAYHGPLQALRHLRPSGSTSPAPSCRGGRSSRWTSASPTTGRCCSRSTPNRWRRRRTGSPPPGWRAWRYASSTPTPTRPTNARQETFSRNGSAGRRETGRCPSPSPRRCRPAAASTSGPAPSSPTHTSSRSSAGSSPGWRPPSPRSDSRASFASCNPTGGSRPPPSPGSIRSTSSSRDRPPGCSPAARPGRGRAWST